MVARAGTLLIPSGPDENPGLRHLHIVCTDPCPNGTQLIVSVSTWRNDLCDSTCILEQVDHPWLTHKSWVMYRAAKVESAATLENGVQQNMFTVQGDMAGDILERVLKGICGSQHTKRGIKKYFGC